MIASDADSGKNGRLAYSIEKGDANNQFSMDPNNGYISVTAPLDREQVRNDENNDIVSWGGVLLTLPTYLFTIYNDEGKLLILYLWNLKSALSGTHQFNLLLFTIDL